MSLPTTRSMPATRVAGADGLRFCLSTEVKARDGNVWEQNYRAEAMGQPLVMLWVHDDRSEVIGRWTGLTVVQGPTGRELHATPDFDDNEDNPLAQRIKRQVEQGFVRYVSLRIEPGSVEAAHNIDDEEHADNDGLVIGRTKPNGLLEASFCPVPADPHASARTVDTESAIEARVTAAVLERFKLEPLPEPAEPMTGEEWLARVFAGVRDS